MTIASLDQAQIRRLLDLAGMRERVYLAGGKLEIDFGDKGTVLRAGLPARASSAGSETSGTQQTAP